MGKKRRQATGSINTGRNGETTEAGKSCAVEPNVSPVVEGVPGVQLAVRAVNHLHRANEAGKATGDLEDVLWDAVRPLIAARAAKYEEDEKATKASEIAKGKTFGPKLGKIGVNLAHKRPISAVTGLSNEEEQPLSGKEVVDAAAAIRTLIEKPDTLADKACKTLRAALHPLVTAHVQEAKASPAFRITCTLGQRARWPEALEILLKLRELAPSQRPKLGAYQRWIRELDVSEGDEQQLLVLDAIMRVAAGLPATSKPRPAAGSLDRLLPWRPACNEPPSDSNQTVRASGVSDCAKERVEREQTLASSENPTSTVGQLVSLIAARRSEASAKTSAASFSVLAHEAAHDRKPPNRFDLDIYTTGPGIVSLANEPMRPVARHEIPFVEGAFMLSSVLSEAECTELRELTENIGYRPDVPVSSQLDERAQNVVLMATQEQHDSLFNRVRNLFPQQIAGDKLVGINRRWRIYRYNSGNLYRKHLDGAWPASGVRTGASGRTDYVYDAYGGGTRSRFTFIVYLNDDFEGGCTTFFVPKPDAEGVLTSCPIKPCIGFATVFPHGDTRVPLLHEGSAVARGAKYLLRTDVVYASPQSPEAIREAARLRGLARQHGIGMAANDFEKTTGGASGKKRKMKRARAGGSSGGKQGDGGGTEQQNGRIDRRVKKNQKRTAKRRTPGQRDAPPEKKSS